MPRTRERRSSRGRFLTAEHRSGFDRRGSDASGVSPITALRDSPSFLLAVLLAINAMNVLDLVLTIEALKAGYAEGNPLMALMFSQGATVAGAFKILCVAGVSAAVWRMRTYRRVLEVALIAFTLFSGVLVLQILGHVFYY